MGTSNLYKGPKKNVLLPSDYIPNNDSDNDNPTADESEGEDETSSVEPVEEEQHCTDTPWRTVRRSMTKALRNRSSDNVRSVIREYTNALGGHTNANLQAEKVKKTATVLYTYFAGSPESVKKRLEDIGILFENRSTKEIFRDICNSIAPIPNDLEASLVNSALHKTFADIAIDSTIDLNQLESYSEELLQKLVGGLVKHYIFDKLILQSEQTALKNCENAEQLCELEKDIKIYIDGIVDGIIPNLVKSRINSKDFNRVIDALCDITYQQMEELK